MEIKDKNNWTTEWPKKEGLYWFYGYRYRDNNYPLKINLVSVMEVSNGFLYSINGAFWFEEEAGNGYFTEAILPDTSYITKFLNKKS